MITPFTLIQNAWPTLTKSDVKSTWSIIFISPNPTVRSRALPPLGINLAKLSENSHYKLDVHIRASDCDVDITTNSKSTFVRIYFFIGNIKQKDPYRAQSLMFPTADSLPLFPT